MLPKFRLAASRNSTGACFNSAIFWFVGRKEAIFGSSLLLLGLVLGIAALRGAADPFGLFAGKTVTYEGLIPIGWVVGAFAWVSVRLKSQKVPFWCLPTLSGRRRLHRFRETGSRFDKPRIWKCAVCGVERKVRAWDGSSDAGGDFD